MLLEVDERRERLLRRDLESGSGAEGRQLSGVTCPCSFTGGGVGFVDWRGSVGYVYWGMLESSMNWDTHSRSASSAGTERTEVRSSTVVVVGAAESGG